MLDGFFPICGAATRPYRTQAGLRDWGLPYAADSAITHHLADFLRDRPRVDAVLFNGGTLHAAVLRQRLLDQIAAWQGSARPIELENAEPDLAVARGAARFGKLLHSHAGRIAAGAARAVFLQVQTAPAATGQPATNRAATGQAATGEAAMGQAAMGVRRRWARRRRTEWRRTTRPNRRWSACCPATRQPSKYSTSPCRVSNCAPTGW